MDYGHLELNSAMAEVQREHKKANNRAAEAGSGLLSGVDEDLIADGRPEPGALATAGRISSGFGRSGRCAHLAHNSPEVALDERWCAEARFGRG